MKYYNFKARQAGMTLIELTVVLLVLIGLAGLMIPYVSGFLQKTHDSTGTNNLARMNGNFGRFESQFMRNPDGLETLVNGSSGGAYGNLMNPQMFYTVTVGSSTADSPENIRAASLNGAGIQTVIANDDATDDATFKSTGSNTEIEFSNTMGSVVAVNIAAVCKEDDNAMMGTTCTLSAGAAGEAEVVDHMVEAFGGTAADYDATCFDYLAFGVGDQSEMVGRTMQSAPIHFASNGDMGPTSKYNRFVAVYKVDKDNTNTGCSTNTEPAKFVGSAMSMMQNHLWGLGHSAGHAYENIAN